MASFEHGDIPPGLTKQNCDCRLVFLLECDVRKRWPGYTVQKSTAQRDTWRSQRFKQCSRLFYSPVSPLVARTQSVFLTLRWSLSVDTGNHDGLLSLTLVSLMSRLNVSPGLRCVTLLTPKQPCYRSVRREIDFGRAVVCACMSVRACTREKHTGVSGSPDAGSWARKWSSAHGSVPAGSWGSSGGRPGTPPAAGAAVPAQTGPPSPRSASPVPAGANYASHQSSACRGQMPLSSCRHYTQAPQVERHSPTQWVRDFKDKDDEPALIETHTHTQAEVPEEGGERQKLPLSLVRRGTASQGQVARSRLRQRRRLAQTRSTPLPSLAAPEKEDRGSGRVSTVWVAEPTANLCSALQQQLLHCVFSTAGLSLRSLKRVSAKL